MISCYRLVAILITFATKLTVKVHCETLIVNSLPGTVATLEASRDVSLWNAKANIICIKLETISTDLSFKNATYIVQLPAKLSFALIWQDLAALQSH